MMNDEYKKYAAVAIVSLIVFSGIAFGIIYAYTDGAVLEQNEQPNFDFPQGANSETIAMSYLSPSHDRVLRNTSYTVTFRVERGSGPQQSTNIRLYKYQNGTAFVRDIANKQVNEQYLNFNNNTRYVRVRSNNSSFDSQPLNGTEPFTADTYLSELRVLNTSFVNVTTLDGQKVALYNITEVSQSVSQSDNITATGNVYITEQGYAKKITVSFTTSGPNGISTTQSLEITNIGNTTVNRPSWFEQSDNSTNR